MAKALQEISDQELVDICANACEGNKKLQLYYQTLVIEAKASGNKKLYEHLKKLAKEISECYK